MTDFQQQRGFVQSCDQRFAMTKDIAQHILRNPYPYDPEQIREARLWACDELDRLSALVAAQRGAQQIPDLGTFVPVPGASVSATDKDRLTVELLEWAVSRWREEVSLRPLVNTHRRTLDDTWRQVIRYAGGDPVALIGPAHDELVLAQKPFGKGEQT
jgi:hypothetical protein